MDAPTAASKPCCVCHAPNGKHCAKCKSRHYCSKACQVVDWKRGHNKACRQLAADFQDRLLDELMPEKKPKEVPAIVEYVSRADGAKARLSAMRAAKTADAGAPSDGVPSWRGTCAICLDALPLEGDRKTFYVCCCKTICTSCFVKCRQYDTRCPLCRAPPHESDAEWLRRLQKHVDKGNAEAQIMLGNDYRIGGPCLQQNFQRAFELYERAAAQGNAQAQTYLGSCYSQGLGVEIDHDAAAKFYQRAAEQGYPHAQATLEAVKWFRLAAEGNAEALYNLGACYAKGHGVQQDFDEAMRLCKRAAAKGHAIAAATVDKLTVSLAAARAA